MGLWGLCLLATAVSAQSPVTAVPRGLWPVSGYAVPVRIQAGSLNFTPSLAAPRAVLGPSLSGVAPAPRPIPITPALQAPAAPSWSLGRFESADGGQPVVYKKREGSSPGSPSRVFSGGLALNESFETLFAGQERPAGDQYFLWTRAHPPSAWTPTSSPLDADARDLARLIVLAAKDSPGGKVELVLHSFGTLVFQRLTQLRGEPEADEALRALKGSRVVLLHATTHFEGSEREAGGQLEQMGRTTKQFVDWLDIMDAAAERWRRAAESNPFLAPQIAFWLSQWEAQRAGLMALASRQAATMMKKDLEQMWDPAIDPIRSGFIQALGRDSKDPGWQEALLRRSNDMFRLEMGKEDVEYIRGLGIRLDLVHGSRDELLDWKSARIFFNLLGIETPEAAPEPGAVLKDAAGLFRARIVDGDHYFPLKQPQRLSEILDP